MDNVEKVYKWYEFTPDRIYNCDETALTTVQRPHKIIATKGSKQVGAVTSQERGQLVTHYLLHNQCFGQYDSPCYGISQGIFQSTSVESRDVHGNGKDWDPMGFQWEWE